MKKWLVLLYSLLLAMGLILAGCSSSGTSSSSGNSQPNTNDGNGNSASFDMEPVKWTMVDYADSSSEHYRQHAEFAKAIYERTGGMLDIQHHSVGEFPFGGTDLLSVTADRTIEMSLVSLSYIEGEVPLASLVEWPMLVTNNEEMQMAIDVIEPLLTEEFDKIGVEMIDWWSTIGLGFFGVGDTPKDLSDLANRKIRLYSKPISDILLNYNVVPISMASNEVVPAIQRKVIDAALTGTLYAYDMKWYETIDWAYIMNIAGAANGIFVNKEAMNELPEEVQEIVREEIANYHKVNIEYNETETQNSIEGLAENGTDVVFASNEDYAEAAKLAVSIWEELAEASGAKTKEALAAVREALGK